MRKGNRALVNERQPYLPCEHNSPKQSYPGRLCPAPPTLNAVRLGDNIENRCQSGECEQGEPAKNQYQKCRLAKCKCPALIGLAALLAVEFAHLIASLDLIAAWFRSVNGISTWRDFRPRWRTLYSQNETASP